MAPTRRSFLTTTATAAATTLLANVARAQTQPTTTSKPATTMAATTRANGKPNLAIIGLGGIARWHGGYVGKYTNIVALCDVDKSRLDAYNKDVAGGKAETYSDYRKLLERKDIDVCLVTTPDHWHVKITADALRS